MASMHSRRQAGVTLIELMVGVVIGLLATLVIAQVAQVYEAKKRNTTSGNDAQVNGALALNTLQRDIQAAGYGLTSGGGVGCRIFGRFNAIEYEQRLAPVRIVQNANPNLPVSLQILMSSNTQFSLPMRVFEDHLRNGTEFVLGSTSADLTNVGNQIGDLMMAVPAAVDSTSTCALFTITRVCTAIVSGSCTVANSIQHTVDASAPWNQDGSDATRTPFPGALATSTAYASGSYLVNLGSLIDRTYSINSNTLQLVTFNTTNPTSPTTEQLYADIVNLQAVYGRDTSATADKVVDVWDNTTPTTPDGWSRVIAVRVALVARSTQYEKDIVTATQPTWTPDGSTATTIQVNHLSDWQHYRYRVFEVVVPLRNILWQS